MAGSMRSRSQTCGVLRRMAQRQMTALTIFLEFELNLYACISGWLRVKTSSDIRRLGNDFGCEYSQRGTQLTMNRWKSFHDTMNETLIKFVSFCSRANESSLEVTSPVTVCTIQFCNCYVRLEGAVHQRLCNESIVQSNGYSE